MDYEIFCGHIFKLLSKTCFCLIKGSVLYIYGEESQGFGVSFSKYFTDVCFHKRKAIKDKGFEILWFIEDKSKCEYKHRCQIWTL